MKNIIKLSMLSSSLFGTEVLAQKTGYIQQYTEGEGFIIQSKKTTQSQEVLNQKIASMFTDPVMRNAQWGFVLYDPKEKKIINSYNEKASLIPASTTKLLTTEAAMSLFGKDYQWITQLEHSGEVDSNGNLNGDLYIIGSGDPSLGTGRAGASTYGALVTDFTHSIKNMGIKRIKGDIVMKTGIFGNNKKLVLPANIVWKGNKNYYLPVGSTNDTDPRKEYNLGSKKPEEQKFVYMSPHNQNMVYTDQFGGISLSTKLPDAPYFLANTLKNHLTKNGIITEGKVVSQSIAKNNETRTKITAYESPKLEELVYFINQTSNNAMSEALLKTIGFYKKGDFSLDTGKATMNKHLNGKSFDFYGFNYADGSGLSRSNVVTPMSQVKFLSDLMEERYFDSYFKSLPIAGQTGTLKSMFKNSDSYGQVFAKTGTLNRVKTLAGYIRTKSGKLLTFSLLINNYTGTVSQVKQKMETILAPIVDF